MKPLVIKEKLEELLKSFQDETLKRFEYKLTERNTEIEKLESKLAIKQSAMYELEIKCNDNKQYSRTLTLTAMKIIMSCKSVEFNKNEIDCAHYIGPSSTKKEKSQINCC